MGWMHRVLWVGVGLFCLGIHVASGAPTSLQAKQPQGWKPFFLVLTPWERMGYTKQANLLSVATLPKLAKRYASASKKQQANHLIELAKETWQVSQYYAWIEQYYQRLGRLASPFRENPQQARKKAIEYAKRAATLYYKWIKSGAKPAALCEAYATLAQLLAFMGKPKAGLLLQRRYLRLYSKQPSPLCRFGVQAYLAYGDHYFKNGQITMALRAYQQALKFPKASIIPWVLYRKAWSHYNLVQYSKALQTLTKVYRSLQTLPARKKTEWQRILTDVARNDMILFYSQVGTPKKAFKFFKSFTKPTRYTAFLITLARQYELMKQPISAAIIYQRLLQQTKSPTTKIWLKKTLQTLTWSKTR